MFIQDLMNSFQRGKLPTVFHFHVGRGGNSIWGYRSAKEIQRYSLFLFFSFSFLDLFSNIFNFFSRAGAVPCCLSNPPLNYLYSSPKIPAERRAGLAANRPWISIDPLCLQYLSRNLLADPVATQARTQHAGSVVCKVTQCHRGSLDARGPDTLSFSTN